MKYLITGGEYLKRHKGFELVGREEELKSLSSTLMRSKAASVILTGPGGVGSTAICLGLQACKDDPTTPFDIISKRIHWLDYDGLFTSGNFEKINAEFQRIASVLRQTPDSIIIIEDTKDFIDTARSVGCGHFVNALNSLVKDGHTQAILEVRDDDLGYVLASHSDMRQSYTIIHIDEPKGDNLLKISMSAAGRLEMHHRIKIEPDAVVKAVELTTRYQTRDPSLSRAQPERAHNLLDRAMSTYRMTSHQRDPRAIELERNGGDPTEIAKIDAEYEENQKKLREFYKLFRDAEIAINNTNEKIYEQLEREKNGEVPVEKKSALDSFRAMSIDSGFESDVVKELRKNVEAFQQVIDDKTAEYEKLTETINSRLRLTQLHVLAEFSRLSGIPADKLNEDEREKLKNLAANIKKNLWGQDPVVDALTNAIKIARIGRRNGSKPQASFLFLGPSGVGKTEIVKLLSAELGIDLLRFDMSEFMEKHAVATLIGAPPGYEGYEAGGVLTNAMKKNPRRIVLFDEIEKADPSVFNIFLQMLDAGRLTDRFGQVVSFSEAIIIMTSNIGQPELLDMGVPKEQRQLNALNILTSTPGIRPEFLNRFAGRQNILFFDALEVDSIAKIVRREVNNLDASYAERGVRTIMNDDVLLAFCRDHYDVKVGGRGLPGFIQANLEPYLANMVLDDPDFSGRAIIGYDPEKRMFTTTFEREVEGVQ